MCNERAHAIADYHVTATNQMHEWSMNNINNSDVDLDEVQ